MRVANSVQLFLSNITITCGVGCLGVVGVVYTPYGGASASCFFLQVWFGDDLPKNSVDADGEGTGSELISGFVTHPFYLRLMVGRPRFL